MKGFRPAALPLLAFVAALLALGVSAAALGAAGAVSGRLVFATSGDGVSGRLEIAGVAPDGSAFARITRHTPSGFAPRWTPNGHSIVFSTYDSLTDGGAAWRMGAGGVGFERLSRDSYAAPSPSGSLVAEFGRRGIELSAPGGRRLRTLRLPLGKDDFFDGGIVWSRDERRLAVNIVSETDSGDYVRVFVLRIDGQASARSVSPKIDGRYEYALSWSPDGRMLAIDTGSALEYTTITLVRADGSGRRVLVADAAGSGVQAWSPDGKQLAYVGRKGGIFAIRTATRRARLLARTRSLGAEVRRIDVDWSPTGRELAFSDAGGVFRVRADGSSVRRLTRRGAWGYVDWSPDGRRLTFSEDYEIFVVSANGTGLRGVTHALHDDSPVASPDGRRIAFIRGPRGLANAGRIGVYVVNAAGNDLRRVGRGYFPRWAPDGRRLAFVDVLPDDPPQMVKLRAGRIMIADIDAGIAQQVAVGTAPTWSPDGSHIAFMRYTFDVRDTWRGVTATTTSSALWVVRLDGSEPRMLLASGAGSEERSALHYRPAWSPDGRSIALLGSNVTLVDPETSEVRTLDQHAEEAAWSPDGTRLLIASLDAELRVVDIATGMTRTVDSERTLFSHSSPAWSPDGKHVGFVGCDRSDKSAEDGCDVYVVGADGTGRRRVTRTPGAEGALMWSTR